MGAVENRSHLVLSAVFLFAFSLFLAAYSAQKPWLAQIGVRVVGEVLRPLQFLVHGTAEQTGSIWSGYLNLINTHQENLRLKERLEALEAENSRLREWEPEILRLRNLVHAATETRIEGIAAEVIGYDPSNWVRAITVDKGTLHGIAPGLAVIEGDAVVGQVVAVSPHTSRILLLTDHASAVDGLVQTSRARGMIHGLGKEICEFRYIEQEEVVQVGDRVITSGMDGVYPKGIAIGVVSEIQRSGDGMFQSIRVKPAADFSRLETVLILVEGSIPQETLPLPEGARTKPDDIRASTEP